MSVELSSEYLSEQSRKDLENELERLIKEKRKDISRKLQESSSMGDISENAEYQEAKEEQLMNERRIAELEDLLSRAIVIPQKGRTRLKIEMGCAVVLKKGESEIQCTYQLVGSGEANPMEQKISNESPLGLALLGRKKGQTVKVLTPRGEISYTIIEIT